MITSRFFPLLLTPLLLGAPALAQFTPPTQPLDTGTGGTRATEDSPGNNSSEILFNAPEQLQETQSGTTRSLSSPTRGQGCKSIEAEADLPMIALTPAGSSYAVTDRPSFAVFMPVMDADYASLEIYTADLSDVIVQLDIKLPKTTGILHIQLPEAIASTAALQSGHSYWWAFTPQCGGSFQHLTVTPAWTRGEPSNPYPSAGITRVTEDSEATNPPENLDSLDLAIWYAERGVWFDTVDLLIEAMTDTSAAVDLDRAQRLWSQLIEPQLAELQAEYDLEPSLDLRPIADAPIIPIPPEDITVIFPLTLQTP
jgi:hypothetical protein